MYAAICQLKANYVTATDPLPFPGSEDRALALYRATYTDDAESSAGYDLAAPDFLVHGPDELFETLRAGLAHFSASQHNVGVIHVDLGDTPAHGRRAGNDHGARSGDLGARATLDITRLAATYHDEAEKRRGRWQVTKSFAQYLATETAHASPAACRSVGRRGAVGAVVGAQDPPPNVLRVVVAGRLGHEVSIRSRDHRVGRVAPSDQLRRSRRAGRRRPVERSAGSPPERIQLSEPVIKRTGQAMFRQRPRTSSSGRSRSWPVWV